jgi:hypothetical protein
MVRRMTTVLDQFQPFPAAHRESSTTPPSASLYREHVIYTD